jgi:hypothetical protein
MPPLCLKELPGKTRRLNVGEREKILAGVAAGLLIRAIAARIDWRPSTVLRELRVNMRQRYAEAAYREAAAAGDPDAVRALRALLEQAGRSAGGSDPPLRTRRLRPHGRTHRRMTYTRPPDRGSAACNSRASTGKGACSTDANWSGLADYAGEASDEQGGQGPRG